MKSNSVLFTIFLAGTFIFGCKNRCEVACDPIFPEVKFQIVDTDNKNLIAGPDKIYLSQRIQVKSIVSNNLLEATKYYIGDSTQATASLSFIANALSTQYYLYIDNVKTDSFQVTYQNIEGKSECCASYNAITSLKVNTANTSYTNPGTSDPVKIIK